MLRIILLTMMVVILAVGSLSCALSGSAPPSFPHPADGAYGDCRGCHEQGLEGAPVTDHARKPECLNCHKPSGARGD